MDIEQVREISLSINPHIEECSPLPNSDIQT